LTKGSLIYSAEACDALPLFYRKQFKLLQGGAEGKLEEAVVECAEELVTTRSTQREGAAAFASPTSTKRQRIPGLNRGTIKLGEDFNDPLPDEFWLGIE
jgi:hypothetical protein